MTRAFARAGVLMLAPIFIGASFLLSSCATRPKVYTAPDATKFNASSKKLSTAIAKTDETIARAEARVAAAQKNFDEVSAASVEVRDKVIALSKVVPPEFVPEVNQLLAVVEAKQIKEGELSANLDGAYTEIEQAKKDNAASATAKATLQSDFEVYRAGAIKNAADATAERNKRIAAEKQLSREKWMRLFWRIGGGVLVLGIIVLIVLWWLGKISLKGAKAYVGIR